VQLGGGRGSCAAGRYARDRVEEKDAVTDAAQVLLFRPRWRRSHQRLHIGRGGGVGTSGSRADARKGGGRSPSARDDGARQRTILLETVGLARSCSWSRRPGVRLHRPLMKPAPHGGVSSGVARGDRDTLHVDPRTRWACWRAAHGHGGNRGIVENIQEAERWRRARADLRQRQAITSGAQPGAGGRGDVTSMEEMAASIQTVAGNAPRWPPTWRRPAPSPDGASIERAKSSATLAGVVTRPRPPSSR
jgi:hypothetical protein